MAAYYNEIEPFAAQWLRNLILAGHIAAGEVDERSILDVSPDDLRGFDQCHFFAGIGGWSRALRLVGWPDDRAVWTGSCPCQPFSTAGGRGGFADERHLWPAFHHLVRECRPGVVFGEQVASKDGLGWSDLVQADLEGEGYAIGWADLCAAGVGAPHIRQRAWFVADRDGAGRGQLAQSDGQPIARGEEGQRGPDDARRGDAGELADRMQPGRAEWPAGAGEGSAAGVRGPGELGHSHGEHARRHTGPGAEAEGRPPLRPERDVPVAPSPAGELGDGERQGSQERPIAAFEPGALRFQGSALGEAEPLRGFWRGADWIYCRDGKYRPVEPGIEPLAYGLSFRLGSGCPEEGRSRVGELKGYGNAIVPQVAAELIAAYLECRP